MQKQSIENKSNFVVFKAGNIFNPIKTKIERNIELKYHSAKVTVPSRIYGLCFDPTSLSGPTEKFVYTPGELVFSAGIPTIVEIKASPSNLGFEEVLSTKRKSVVLHVVRMLRSVLGVRDDFYITCRENSIQHCGFGSTAALQTATALAINSLYGDPIKREDLLKLLAQNYGEEIEGNDEELIHVQCIGGAIAVGLYGGGIIALAGQNTVIKQVKIPDGFSFVFGMPKGVNLTDAKNKSEQEAKAFLNFAHIGKSVGQTISYRVLHQLLPAMEDGDLKTIGDIIDYYRFDCSSLDNLEQVCPSAVASLRSLRKKRDGIEVLSISSMGPVIYALTSNPNYARELFIKEGLETLVSRVDNFGSVRALE